MNVSITNKHKNQSFANQTLDWFDLDSKDRWLENMQDPQRREQLIHYGFDQPGTVKYQLNSHGFRCDDFDSRPGFIALGCSFTCGIGLPADQVWPSIVGRAIGLTPWNLGIGAAGLDTCFRLLYCYVDLLKPNFVMMLIPDPDRFEIHNLGTPTQIMHNKIYPSESIETLKKFWFSDDQNSTTNHVKNLLAINELCNNRGIPLISKPLDPTLLGTRRSASKWPASRDLVHVGYQEQQHCAEEFLQALNQN